MHLLILFFLLITASHATNLVSYFKNAPNKQPLYHIGQPIKDKKEGIIF
jgi:hypothetical protein